MSDLQLGYALWAVLIGSSWAAVAARRRDLAVLLASSAFLLILVLPVPLLNAWLWNHMPAEIVRITYYWPMQRFYLILAALLAAAGQVAFATASARGRNTSVIFAVALSAGCIWSLWESRQFIRAASERVASVEGSAQAMRPRISS